MKKKPLPIGWRACDPSSHPLDAGTPVEDWETTVNPRWPRQEEYRWFRGDRYVRICKILGVDKYALHYGDVVTGTDHEESEGGNLNVLTLMAFNLMRTGGYS